MEGRDGADARRARGAAHGPRRAAPVQSRPGARDRARARRRRAPTARSRDHPALRPQPTGSSAAPEPQVRRLRGSVPRHARGDPRRGSCRYADLFAGASDVLDVGCGRGEFLALLAERGVQRQRHRRQRVDGGGVPAEGADGVDARTRWLPARAAGRLARRPAGRAGRRAPGAGLPDATCWTPRGRRCAPARRSCSKPSTRRAGSRSSKATSATSRTCGRCTPTR